MPHIYIKRPSCVTERMLRELMGPPLEQYDFVLAPCGGGHDHYFDMHLGGELVGPFRVGTWKLNCSGPPGDSCPTQRAPDLHPRRLGQVWAITEDFTRRCFGDQMLNAAREHVEAMDTSFLPLPFTGRVPGSAETSHIYSEPDSDDDEPEGQDDDPDWEDIKIFEPKEPEDWNHEGIFIRVVAFMEQDTQPFYGRFLLAAPGQLDLSAYRVPAEWSHGTLLAYSVLTKKYEDFRGLINMEGRGRILILRRRRLHQLDCPRSATWERWALKSAAADAADDLPASSAPASLPPSSESTAGSSGIPTGPFAVASTSKAASNAPSGNAASTSKAPPAATLAASTSKAAGKRRAGAPAVTPAAVAPTSKADGKRKAQAQATGARKKRARGTASDPLLRYRVIRPPGTVVPSPSRGARVAPAAATARGVAEPDRIQSAGRCIAFGTASHMLRYRRNFNPKILWTYRSIGCPSAPSQNSMIQQIPSIPPAAEGRKNSRCQTAHPGQGRGKRAAPRARSDRCTRCSEKVISDKLHAGAILMILELAPGGVDGIPRFNLQAVDFTLEFLVEGVDNADNGVEVAAEVLVEGLGDVREGLRDGVGHPGPAILADDGQLKNYLPCGEFSAALGGLIGGLRIIMEKERESHAAYITLPLTPTPYPQVPHLPSPALLPASCPATRRNEAPTCPSTADATPASASRLAGKPLPTTHPPPATLVQQQHRGRAPWRACSAAAFIRADSRVAHS
ncbi:hypothetical protein B0H17DRAFT_1144001 [Mycena rosella]|uniref:Uncharacterized protein n=1 Tax=Mycena rosella TaxID=1033263 RepID=A0AAD7CTP5_MYCRO|nr:hypothetical protein B0H17DRAFT_1144001 [Mycena rosella]